jgi:hypothetical protein
LVTPGTHAQDDAREVGADDVVVAVVTLGELRGAAVALEEPERRHRLEDRGPHGVVVDGAGHDGDEGLTGRELGGGHLLDVQGLARVLVAAGQTLEHQGLVLVHGRGPIGLRHLDPGVGLLGAVPGEDGLADLVHAVVLLWRRRLGLA